MYSKYRKCRKREFRKKHKIRTKREANKDKTKQSMRLDKFDSHVERKSKTCFLTFPNVYVS